ncbi:MAG: hypothetical protein WCC46_16495 [Terriglobales bacterium]|jgi:16S rRNA G1207 methylase RsmC
MAKTLVETVVHQLHQERSRLENELHRITAALTTFGRVFAQGGKAKPVKARKKSTISAAGRKRIAAAQKARWAKVRAAKKQK